jgi:hypothetical protein
MTRATPKPWTEEELTLLQQLRAAGMLWPDIALRTGHSAASCSTTHSALSVRRQLKTEQDVTAEQPLYPKRPWTEGEITRLMRLREIEQLKWVEIDAMLFRVPGSSCGKYESLRRRKVPFLDDETGAFEQRPWHQPKKVPVHNDLTAEFFGDPLPGRSALDKKTRRRDTLAAAHRFSLGANPPEADAADRAGTVMAAIRLDFTTRAIPRSTWKIIFRQMRIINRESKMAYEDMIIFGTGCLQTGPDVPDFIRRVHPSNLDIRLMGQR